MLGMHGREAFTGPRKVHVYLANGRWPDRRRWQQRLLSGHPHLQLHFHQGSNSRVFPHDGRTGGDGAGALVSRGGARILPQQIAHQHAQRKRPATTTFRSQ